MLSHRNPFVVFRGERIPLLLEYRRSSEPSRGYTYTCPKCGEQWGLLETTDNPNGLFHNVTSPCEKHGTPHRRGGSYLQTLLWWVYPGTRENLLNNLTERMVRHEALMKVMQDERSY